MASEKECSCENLDRVNGVLEGIIEFNWETKHWSADFMLDRVMTCQIDYCPWCGGVLPILEGEPPEE